MLDVRVVAGVHPLPSYVIHDFMLAFARYASETMTWICRHPHVSLLKTFPKNFLTPAATSFDDERAHVRMSFFVQVIKPGRDLVVIIQDKL
jgi:hypothetical protein